VLDHRLRPLIDLALARAGRHLAASVSANTLTILALLSGLAAAGCIAVAAFKVALVMFLVGRCLDGLDGAVARASTPTDRGGYLDIVLDFAVYAAVPLAFAYVAPAENALAAAALLAAIILNASAFLAFSAMAAKRRLESAAQGRKSLYFLAGLAEGGETVAFYVAFCVWPHQFATLAYAFAALCVASAIGRIGAAWRALGPGSPG
jgi:phosphatidylglycerophosphate synthase